MTNIIRLELERMQSLHFFVKGLRFPVVVGLYSDRDELQVDYLLRNIRHGSISTKRICIWCINHQISYQILYPIGYYEIIRNPLKYFEFLVLRRYLRGREYTM